MSQRELTAWIFVLSVLIVGHWALSYPLPYDNPLTPSQIAASATIIPGSAEDVCGPGGIYELQASYKNGLVVDKIITRQSPPPPDQITEKTPAGKILFTTYTRFGKTSASIICTENQSIKIAVQSHRFPLGSQISFPTPYDGTALKPSSEPVNLQLSFEGTPSIDIEKKQPDITFWQAQNEARAPTSLSLENFYDITANKPTSDASQQKSPPEFATLESFRGTNTFAQNQSAQIDVRTPVTFKPATVDTFDRVVRKELEAAQAAERDTIATLDPSAVQRGEEACANSPFGQTCARYRVYQTDVGSRQAGIIDIANRYSALQACRNGDTCSPDVLATLSYMEKGQGLISGGLDAGSKNFAFDAKKTLSGLLSTEGLSGYLWESLKLAVPGGNMDTQALMQCGQTGSILCTLKEAGVGVIPGWIAGGVEMLGSGILNSASRAGSAITSGTLGLNPSPENIARCYAVGKDTCSLEATGHVLNLVALARTLPSTKNIKDLWNSIGRTLEADVAPRVNQASRVMGVAGKLTNKKIKGVLSDGISETEEAVEITFGVEISPGGEYAKRGVYEVRIKFLDNPSQNELPAVAKMYDMDIDNRTLLRTPWRYADLKEAGIPVPKVLKVDIGNRMIIASDLNEGGLVAVSSNSPTNLVSLHSILIPNVDALSTQMANALAGAANKGLIIHSDSFFWKVPATRVGIAQQRAPIDWIVGDFDNVVFIDVISPSTVRTNLKELEKSFLQFIEKYAIPQKVEEYSNVVRRNVSAARVRHGISE
jgi:hypothetical protein